MKVNIYVLVTKEKPFQVRIYKVQKSEKEVFKKKQCWQLSDLKLVDGKEDTHVSIINHVQSSGFIQSSKCKSILNPCGRNNFLKTFLEISYCHKGDLKSGKSVVLSQTLHCFKIKIVSPIL